MGKRKDIRERVYIFLKMMELFIAACIVAMVLVLMAITLKEYLTGHVSLYNEEALNIFLQQMLSFAVAVEFVKMLIYHNPERVIDVLIFATSRQLVVEHTNGMESLIRIFAIGVLFAIQKFLLPSSDIFPSKSVRPDLQPDEHLKGDHF